MKKRIFSTLLALVLLLTLGLVTALPGAASPEDTYAGYTLQEVGSGTADWSTAVTPPSGSYSVKLTALTGESNFAKVQFPISAAFSDFAAPSLYYKIDEDALATSEDMQQPDYRYMLRETSAVTQAYLSAYPIIYISDGTTVVPIVGQAWAESTKVDWTKWDNAQASEVHTEALWHDAGRTVPALGGTIPGWWAPLSWWQTRYADFDVVDVGVGLGFFTTTGQQSAYVDDVTINGVTYDLEPIFLDTAHPYFYTSGSPVTVTVPHALANTDPNRPETVSVSVVSILDPTGFQVDEEGEGGIVLTETGPDTGVFQGSFLTTLAIPPGAGELVVADADTITVTYGGTEVPQQVDWGTGASTDITTIEGTVDDSVPTIEDIVITELQEGIVYNSRPTISAVLDDVGSDIDTDEVVMRVDGLPVTPDILTTSLVEYQPSELEAFAAGSTFEVTVDAKDNVGNSAVQVSLTFTIASALTVTVSPTTWTAGFAEDLTVTITDVTGKGPGAENSTLAWAKVVVTAPVGQSLATGNWAGEEIAGEPLGDAVWVSATQVKFENVLPNDASSDITVTVTGQLAGEVAADPVTIHIPVSGYLVSETWEDVGLETTGAISLRVTTKAGAAVNTGIVTITAELADGFEKDVDPLEEGDESFQTIVINGALGTIKYGDANPEDFVASDGNYEVTGITFAKMGAVSVLVQNAGEAAQASFLTAFRVLGNEDYTLDFEPATLTAGVDHESLKITVTDAGDPVTDVHTITIDGVGIAFTKVENVYTVDPDLVKVVDTLSVQARDEAGTKYGTANLPVEVPTVISDTELMLPDVAYTVNVTVTDALEDPLDGYLWIGTYDGTDFSPLSTIPGPPIDLAADGTGEFVVTPTAVGTLVWKVGGSNVEANAALVEEPEIAVRALYLSLDWDPQAPEVDEVITFTVTDNYDDPAGDIDVIVVSPGGDPTEKVTTPTGVFMYTPTEPGDYYVSVGEQDPVTVTVVVTRLASIASAPESVSLYVEVTEQLAITATYEDESTADVTADADAIYESSDTSVATVDAGLITAVAEGEAVITVTYTEGVLTKTAELLVTVTEVPVLESIDDTGPSEISLEVADLEQLAIIATYSDTSTANVTADATYTSDAESVATVSETGLITAVAVGEATITVSYTEDEITVTTDVLVTVIEVEPLTIQLYEGANPIYYTGATMDLPAALTNISAITEIIWQRDVSTGGAWWYYSVPLDYGEITQLENGTVYIIVVSEDCIWELSQ